MLTVHDVSGVREIVRAWRASGQRVAFVPTMGNLHEGHYSLLRIASAHADRVVASVFVNPTQFGPSEDYSRYPRTLDQDQAGLKSAGCDLMFAPSVEEVYPYGSAEGVLVRVPVVTGPLDGEFRPGHFDGVATVVAKLFNFVQPDVAVFGRKDYQQLLTIRRLVRDLGFPIEIVAAPTVREPDGLAMSSRNQYLSPPQRMLAASLNRELHEIASRVRAGEAPDRATRDARARLTQNGFVVDYIDVRDERDLSVATPDMPPDHLVALVAARLGTTRLIDNLPIAQIEAVQAR